MASPYTRIASSNYTIWTDSGGYATALKHMGRMHLEMLFQAVKKENIGMTDEDNTGWLNSFLNELDKRIELKEEKSVIYGSTHFRAQATSLGRSFALGRRQALMDMIRS